jgi:hypothetical protein
MNQNEHGSNGNEGSDGASVRPVRVHPGRPPYWTRAHRDWRIWVGLAFMFAAIIIYVMSDDLAFLPHRQP